MSLQLSNRIHWIDYAKGIGILLVVVGHVCRGLTASFILNPAQAQFIDQWIYAFHISLFFFLSGLLTWRFASKSLKDLFLNKLQTIVYPYFLWSIVQEVLISSASRYTNSSADLTNLWRIIYEPVLIFWFLYTIFVITMIYEFAHKLKLSPIQFLCFSLFLYCLHLLGSISLPWTVPDRVFFYTIYFAIGVIIGNSNLLYKLNQASTTVGLCVTTAGFLLITVAVWLKLTENQLLVPLIAIIGISAVIALSTLLERFKFANFVMLWGSLSLQIYVVHTIVTSGTRITIQKIFGITDPFPHILLGTILGIYVPIAICKFQYLFTLRPRKI